MIRKIADNIYSPLGVTTAENYAAVKQGRSMLRSYPAGTMDLPEAFTASLFDWGRVEPLDGYTRFERIVIQSVGRALAQTDIDVHSDRVLFVLSTTKGNVELLDSRSQQFPADRVLPGVAARVIAAYFGFCREPLVVSNACISGLSAQITAMRLIESGACDVAVVCGADVQSRFIISGFGSFKALSPMECRPFDIERLGLNLGEAASTVILGKSSGAGTWRILDGSLDNDSYHVSAPDPTGDGVRRVIEKVVAGRDVSDLATVCVHGTGTMFNDEMESKAIAAAGLSGVPVSSYKAYFGHTMGACGLLETVLALYALDQGVILEQGSPKEIFGNPKNERTREFLSRYLEDKQV